MHIRVVVICLPWSVEYKIGAVFSQNIQGQQGEPVHLEDGRSFIPGSSLNPTILYADASRIVKIFVLISSH